MPHVDANKSNYLVVFTFKKDIGNALLLTTTGNLDNIAHDPSSTSAKTSFHDSAISPTQHRSQSNTGLIRRHEHVTHDDTLRDKNNQATTRDVHSGKSCCILQREPSTIEDSGLPGTRWYTAEFRYSTDYMAGQAEWATETGRNGWNRQHLVVSPLCQFAECHTSTSNYWSFAAFPWQRTLIGHGQAWYECDPPSHRARQSCTGASYHHGPTTVCHWEKDPMVMAPAIWRRKVCGDDGRTSH